MFKQEVSGSDGEHAFVTGGVLVTGAARRIGAAIACRLARDGYAVALHCLHSRAEAEALAQGLMAEGGRVAVVSGDLADPDVPARLVTQAADAVGPLVALVNNASMFEIDGVGSLDAALWDRQLAVNLRAPVFLAEAFAAQVPEPGKGCVVNILDQRVLKPTPAHLSYTLSKTALMTATLTLAQALAPRIRVVAVGPGPTLANARQSAAEFDRQGAATPLGRGSRPEEIADAVAFLLGAESVTGVMLPVDGGQHLSWRAPDAED